MSQGMLPHESIHSLSDEEEREVRFDEGVIPTTHLDSSQSDLSTLPIQSSQQKEETIKEIPAPREPIAKPLPNHLIPPKVMRMVADNPSSLMYRSPLNESQSSNESDEENTLGFPGRGTLFNFLGIR